MVSREAPKGKSYGADSNGRGVSVHTLGKGGRHPWAGERQGANEGSQQKLLLTPPTKGRGIRVEISSLIKTAKMQAKSRKERCTQGRKITPSDSKSFTEFSDKRREESKW